MSEIRKPILTWTSGLAFVVFFVLYVWSYWSSHSISFGWMPADNARQVSVVGLGSYAGRLTVAWERIPKVHIDFILSRSNPRQQEEILGLHWYSRGLTRRWPRWGELWF